MTIRHLKIFTEVCRTESVTRAAEALQMAQPAVSSVIRELEDHYQVKLFERMNRRLYITEAGQFLAEQANAILAQLDEIEDMIGDVERTSRIRLGSNSSFGASYLPELLEAFGTRHPEISLYTRIENSSRMEDALLHNELDLAVVDNLSDSHYFHSRLLLTDEMTLVCSPDFPYLSSITSEPDFFKSRSISAETLASLPLLLRESGSGSRSIIDKIFRMLGPEPRIISESTNTQALIQLCLRDAGVMMLTWPQAEPYLEEQRLLHFGLKDFDLSRPYYLICHKSKYLTKGMNTFLRELPDLLSSVTGRTDPAAGSFSAPSDNGFS